MGTRGCHFAARVPRSASGIRSQLSRGSGAVNEWHRRWLASLESMNLGARLGRGRNYAASGQVVAMEISGPRVEARVRGCRDEDYAVALDFRHPEGEARRRIVERLRSEPMTVARLWANDLPLAVEEAFRDEGFDLYPGRKLAERSYDTTSSCSCPDWANPCKHAAAVLLLVGEAVAHRPALLLELRGITLGELTDEG